MKVLVKMKVISKRSKMKDKIKELESKVEELEVRISFLEAKQIHYHTYQPCCPQPLPQQPYYYSFN